MNIVIATGIYPPDIGGPATYSYAIGKLFQAHNHSVKLCVYSKIAAKWPRGVSHFVYFLNVWNASRQADVVFAQDPVSSGLPALWAARLRKKKIVVRIAGDYAWEQGVNRFGVTELLDEFLQKKYGWRIELLRACERYVARRAQYIIVPSAYLKSVVMAWGISEKKIEVIYNGVEMPAPPTSKEQARRELVLPSGPIFLSAGRMVPWKGFRMLIRIMVKFPAATLIIVGDGPEKKALEHERDRLQLSGRVLMPGSIRKDLLWRYIVASDAFLLNTGYEGHSHQLLEVMGVGVPVITTNAGGNKELVEDGINAMIVEYNNETDWARALQTVLDDTNAREAIARNARATAAKYSFEKMAGHTLEFFERI